MKLAATRGVNRDSARNDAVVEYIPYGGNESRESQAAGLRERNRERERTRGGEREREEKQSAGFGHSSSFSRKLIRGPH